MFNLRDKVKCVDNSAPGTTTGVVKGLTLGQVYTVTKIRRQKGTDKVGAIAVDNLPIWLTLNRFTLVQSAAIPSKKAATVPVDNNTEDPKPKKCICDIVVLLGKGCQCGGV